MGYMAKREFVCVCFCGVFFFLQFILFLCFLNSNQSPSSINQYSISECVVIVCVFNAFTELHLQILVLYVCSGAKKTAFY